MPLLQWSDIVEVTHDDAKQSLLSLLATVGFAATSWQEGSVPLACVELSAEIWAQLSKVAVFLKTMGLNDTAVDDALTKYSSSQYDNDRNLATTARRRTALSCAASAGPYTINVGDVVLQHPDGPTYRNIDDGVVIYPAVIPRGGTLAGLLFEAEVAGTAANKASQTVTGMVTTLSGVAVSSDQINRDGTDDESNDRLRTRNKTKWSLLTRFEMIRDAVVNLALSAADGITIVAVDDTNPRGAGTFDVYVAGDTATAGADDVTAALTLLNKYVMGSGAPEPIVRVIAAPEQQLNITGTVYFKGAFDPGTLQTATLQALLDLIKTVPLGGFDYSPGPSHVLPLVDIKDAIQETQIAGQSVSKTLVLSSPSVDVPVSAYSKVVLGTINLTFTRVTAP